MLGHTATGDGSERKVANSFSLGVDYQDGHSGDGTGNESESWPLHSALAWLPRRSCLLARFNGHRVATLVVAVIVEVQ